MKKYTTADRLRQIMAERGLRQIDILDLCKPYCEKYGVKLGRNDISQYIAGKAAPKQDKLTILGLGLNVNEAWLMGYDEVLPERSVPIPDAAEVLTAENAHLIAKIRKDPDLTEALKLYFTLPEEKRRYVLDLITMLANSSR